MSLTVNTGIVGGAIKACVYGVEGVGKTTFASKWPNAVFIDCEGGTKRYDVARMPDPRNWEMLLSEIKEASENPQDVGTLVIDTADAAEEMCVAHVLDKYNKSSMEDWAYQAGWRYVYEEMRGFVGELDRCIAAGINIVVVAHALIVKFEQPDEQGAYDRYEMKLHKGKSTNVAALFKEWADLLLFVNFKTDVMKDDKSKKVRASGGTKRVMYAQRRAAYDAKNRFGLDASMPFEFEQIAHIFTGEKPEPKPESKPESKPSILDGAKVEEVTPENIQQLIKLIEGSGLTEVALRLAVANNPRNSYAESDKIADYSPKFIDSLIAHWDAVSKSAEKFMPYGTEEIPF